MCNLLTVVKLGSQDLGSKCVKTHLEVDTYISKVQKMRAIEHVGLLIIGGWLPKNLPRLAMKVAVFGKDLTAN